MENFAFLYKSRWINLYMHIFLLVYITYLVQNEVFAFLFVLRYVLSFALFGLLFINIFCKFMIEYGGFIYESHRFNYLLYGDDRQKI